MLFPTKVNKQIKKKLLQQQFHVANYKMKQYLTLLFSNKKTNVLRFKAFKL